MLNIKAIGGEQVLPVYRWYYKTPAKVILSIYAKDVSSSSDIARYDQWAGEDDEGKQFLFELLRIDTEYERNNWDDRRTREIHGYSLLCKSVMLPTEESLEKLGLKDIIKSRAKYKKMIDSMDAMPLLILEDDF